MSTQPSTLDQTFEQLAGMWNDLAGWSANFASGVVVHLTILDFLVLKMPIPSVSR